jgi:MFS family permease
VTADLAATFLAWTFTRAVFHRGYVLVSTLYFVVNAHLSGSELVLLGTTVSAALLVSDIPTGVWSDAWSRKWPLVLGHTLVAAGMVMTGFVTAFGLLVITQVLWGVGWGLCSGAEVAWITDELDQPARIDRVLAARARWELIGSGAGIVAFGGVAWATSLATAIVASGIAMALIAVFVAARFPEQNFKRTSVDVAHASFAILQKGLHLARRDREIVLVLAATMLVNAAAQISWVFPKQLLKVGLPGDPVLAYSTLIVLSFALGALAVRAVEPRIHGVGVARRSYSLACWIGGLGLAMLAYTTNFPIAAAGLVLANGVSFSVTRAVSVIWVNRRVTSDVRATVHSFLGQAEYVGEVAAGLGLAAVAALAGITGALVAAALLIAAAAALVAWSRADRVRASVEARER